MPTWSAGQWPYPNSSDAPDVAGDLLKLAKRSDLISGDGIGYSATTAIRVAKVTNGDAFVGFMDYDAQLDTVFEYVGSGNWRIVWSQRNVYQRKANQSIANATVTTLNMDTAVMPLTSLFTFSAGVFTAQRVCTVLASAVVDFNANATGGRVIYLQKNGSSVSPGGQSDLGAVAAGVDVTLALPEVAITLAVGDTLNVAAQQTSGAGLAVTGQIIIEQIA